MGKKEKLGDSYRFISAPALASGAKSTYRTEYDRDYARVLHSPSFRRLQNKTQLFPGQESDFFRNRLTHSLEVSQIAASIACKLKAENPKLKIEPQVCQIAGLVHDIGHPPFGHNGEAALDQCMYKTGGFEGNAQTFRILTRLEKKESPPGSTVLDRSGNDCRVGLNLTARVLASALKYDHEIPAVRGSGGVQKGYYHTEKELVDKLKECLHYSKATGPNSQFKTVECAVMDLADDIAYSTYDLEDAFKAGFLTPYDVAAADDQIYTDIVEKLKKSDITATTEECRTTLLGMFMQLWDPSVRQQTGLDPNALDSMQYRTKTIKIWLNSYNLSQEMASNGYMRNKLTSGLVNMFINGIELELDTGNPLFSRIYFNEETQLRVNVLKHFTYVSLINSPMLKVVESRGAEIVFKMFDKLTSTDGQVLLPKDVRNLYELSTDELWRKRVICDFIAGMTDRYAMEFYGRLFSENPQTIFKPLG